MAEFPRQEEYDIIIIGAGPAGCMFAREAPSDLKMLLIDQSKLPRDKPCGGMLVEETHEIIDKLNLPKSVFSKPETLDLIHWDWDNNLQIKQKRDFYNINRQKFDYWLLRLIEKRVEISSQTRLSEFKEKNDGINLVLQKNGETRIIKTKCLVGADGALSAVRKGLNGKYIRRYTAFQEWINLEDNIDDAYFIYDSSITNFYSWLIPKEEYLIVGSALEDDIIANFTRYKQKLKEHKEVKVKTIKKEAHLILRPESTDDVLLGRNKILLIGEAAGLISSSTGEGISFGLRSAIQAAKAFKEDRKNPLEFYKTSCSSLVKEVGEKIEKGNILSNSAKRAVFLKKIDGQNRHTQQN